jgi:hypothetical protein
MPGLPNGASSSRASQTMEPRPILSFGTASLVAFALASGVMLASTLMSVYTHLETKGVTDQSLWATSLIVLMIRLTPVYLLGVMWGFIGLKRSHDNAPSARIGVWFNGWALVPMNLVPLVGYYFHLIGR